MIQAENPQNFGLVTFAIGHEGGIISRTGSYIFVGQPEKARITPRSPPGIDSLEGTIFYPRSVIVGPAVIIPYKGNHMAASPGTGVVINNGVVKAVGRLGRKI